MRGLIIFIAAFFSIAAKAQTSYKQTITTAWGHYVNTGITGHGNILLQVSVEGQNSTWNGVFSINGVNTWTPDVTWNNAKLISFSGYNANVDDVKALVMSNTPSTTYNWTTIVFKIGSPANGSATITVVATAATAQAFALSLSDYSTSPFTYTMASSAGTYNMWTVNKNVGIGTYNPQSRLYVVSDGLGSNNGDRTNISSFETSVGNNTSFVELYNYRIASGSDWLTASTRLQQRIDAADMGFIEFNPPGMPWGLALGTNNAGRLYINNDGNIGIGTKSINDNNYTLFVEKGIRTRKVKVDQANWPDYVFEPNYKLPSLKEIERFIQQHRHLPEVPSANQVSEQGLDMGENQAVLLKKIEELTLYIIEQDKKIENQNILIQRLEDQNKELLDVKKDIEIIKAGLRTKTN
jgi:hypothetical protein